MKLSRPTKQRFLNGLLERLAARTGRVVYKSHLLWLVDDSWRRPFDQYLAGDARKRRSALRIGDRRFTLIQLAGAVRHLQGSTVECGVFTGIGSALICQTLAGTYAADELHFGFDSFEGIAEPVAEDRSGLATWWEAGDLAVPLEVATERLQAFDQVRLVPGWIPDSFDPAGAAEHRYRLVHIDVDLHDATRDSLAYFYPKMVPGGVIVLDDHGFASCPGARKAAEDFFADKPEPLIELPTGQAFLFRAG